ncbi:MAG: nicotinate (nicotinamide) nucleotide adenylyltransferase [Phycisphaerae bacterium]
MAPKRIGILGGTFDPVHLGHLIPAEYAFNHLKLDSLLLVPAGNPVHRPRQILAPAEHRLRMCRLAVEPLPGFGVSDIEITRSEPSYTVLTLEHFRETLGPASRLRQSPPEADGGRTAGKPGADLFLLAGDDNLPLLHTWRRLPDILALATVVLLPRPGVGNPDLGPLRKVVGPECLDRVLAHRVPGPLVPISATDIRRRVGAGKSIRGLVPAPVADYIASHGLYRSPDASAG